MEKLMWCMIYSLVSYHGKEKMRVVGSALLGSPASRCGRSRHARSLRCNAVRSSAGSVVQTYRVSLLVPCVSNLVPRAVYLGETEISLSQELIDCTFLGIPPKR